MEQCFKCKSSFPPHELIKKKSGKSFCQVCVLYSFYKCEHCGEKFLLNNFATDYKQAKSLGWQAKLEHVNSYHA